MKLTTCPGDNPVPSTGGCMSWLSGIRVFKEINGIGPGFYFEIRVFQDYNVLELGVDHLSRTWDSSLRSGFFRIRMSWN